MLKGSSIRFKRFIALLIFIAMAYKAYSQDSPAFDRISTSAGNVDMYFIGHGSLMFKVNDFIIYFDPVRSSGSYDKMPKADLILVTHEHGDHLDAGLINDLRKPSTVLLCSEKAAANISWAQIMKADDENTVNGIKIKAVPAYNIVNVRAPGQPFHPKGSGIGYVLSIGDKKFYVAGDTENTPEMKALKDIDVAFLPMNLPYTMTPQMVADAVLAFRPKILYPYHYGDTDTKKIVDLLKNTDITVRIRELR